MAPGEPRRTHRERERVDRHSNPHHAAKRKSRAEGDRDRNRRSRAPPASDTSGSLALSADSLARLNLINQHEASRTRTRDPERAKRKKKVEVPDERFVVDKRRQQKKKKRRVVSGAMLEEGDGERLRGIRGGRGNYDEKREYTQDGGGGKKKKKICMIINSQVVERELTVESDRYRYRRDNSDYHNRDSDCSEQEEEFGGSSKLWSCTRSVR